MPPKKSIFRQPGARHFQLVHRSQRDPLIHDPEASQHVLKPIERENVKKGKSRADLESDPSLADLTDDFKRANIGEASAYGVYYDDTEYDYMQHLKPVGLQEDGVDSILLEAPVTKAKGKAKIPIELRDLPVDVLPSTSELPRNYETQEAVPSSIAGFQPDLNPHLRQVLEALEDDAFVDDGLEDDFFGELVGDGERAEDDEFDFEFREEGVDEGAEEWIDEEEEAEGANAPEGWEARFERFKTSQKEAVHAKNGSDVDYESEDGDTIGGLPHMSVIGAKRRRRKTSDASGFSMSSSSMYRNEHLTILDDRFDKIEKEYDDQEEEDDDMLSDGESDEAPQLLTSREDFESMMDEFLDQYEILGGKMKPVLSGGDAAQKLDTLRRAMGQDERVRVANGDSDDEADILMPLDIKDKQDRWDCETILSTYSNLENHPRLIRARQTKPVPKIHLDPRSGLPIVIERQPPLSIHPTLTSEDEEESTPSVRATITRSRNESKEEKKARKQAVKAERQTRRLDKKATREQYSAEIKHQARGLAQKDTAKIRKL
ncbi:hypothetical protein JAAARDRAFT_29021 [Jaapia argillacea MUCL 33604]|uniref:Low temperature viability protein n=1 Tax=Jaapia argillacea MUCL 33604 TaxID=933084 RepID=A0A067QA41_9AGAM|nr:hypothetical protein JAAARDRAFT_29021 [Jaapia argillacea MUCL 33604]